MTLSGSFAVNELIGHELVPNSSIVISFVDEQISVRAGCNAMSGGFRIEDGQLLVGSMSQTEMGCDQSLMDQDSWVAAFLGASPYVNLSGETLSLTGHGIVAEAMTLRFFSPQPTSSLKHSWWGLETSVRDDVASSVPNGVAPTIAIAEDTIKINAQCNAIGGNVAIGDGTLTITEVVSTRRACDGARGEMESLLTDVLKDTVPYSLIGDQLTITGANGVGLIFDRMPLMTDGASMISPEAAPQTS